MSTFSDAPGDRSRTTPTNSSDRTLGPLVLDGYLSREELAQQLDVNTRTIDRWESLGQGPPRVAIGRTILYKLDSVRDWLASRETLPIALRRSRDLTGVKPRPRSRFK